MICTGPGVVTRTPFAPQTIMTGASHDKSPRWKEDPNPQEAGCHCEAKEFKTPWAHVKGSQELRQNHKTPPPGAATNFFHNPRYASTPSQSYLILAYWYAATSFSKPGNAVKVHPLQRCRIHDQNQEQHLLPCLACQPMSCQQDCDFIDNWSHIRRFDDMEASFLNMRNMRYQYILPLCSHNMALASPLYCEGLSRKVENARIINKWASSGNPCILLNKNSIR